MSIKGEQVSKLKRQPDRIEILLAAIADGSTLIPAEQRNMCKCGHTAVCHVEAIEYVAGSVTSRQTVCWARPWQTKWRKGYARSCDCTKFKRSDR